MLFCCLHLIVRIVGLILMLYVCINTCLFIDTTPPTMTQTPASIQAALAAVDLPPMVADSITKFDAAVSISKASSRRSNASALTQDSLNSSSNLSPKRKV